MQSILNLIIHTFSSLFIFLNEWYLLPGVSFLSIIILSILLCFLAKEIINNKE